MQLRGGGEDGQPRAQAVIKGDSSCVSIAAASIVAKVQVNRVLHVTTSRMLIHTYTHIHTLVNHKK